MSRLRYVATDTPEPIALPLAGDGAAQPCERADAAANRPVSLQRPEWRFAFDTDSPMAVDTRKRLIDLAVEKGWPLFTPHFPWPAIGRIVRESGGIQWTPGI